MTLVRTPEQIKELEDSFRALSAFGEKMAGDFFDRFFEHVPEARSYFEENNLQSMRGKLLLTLTMTIQNLRQPDVLHGLLSGLGERHLQDYKVPVDMIPRMKLPLLTTFAIYLKDDWTPKLEATWSEAFDSIVQIMTEGEKQHKKGPGN